MKKLSTVLIIFLMLQTLTACSAESAVSNVSSKQTQSESGRSSASDGSAAIYQTSSDSLKYWSPDELKAVKSLLAKADNVKSPDELIHTNYPEKSLVSEYLTLGYNPNAGNNISLTALNSRYPVACMRKTTGDSLYCVYKTKEGGRFYLFFFSTAPYSWTYDFSLYSKKILRYSDFSALKVGDSLSAVERIDSACSFYQPVYPLKQINTRHLLKDGILNVDYSRNSAGNYLITRITYSKDFQFKGSRVDKSGNRLTENCSILPQDYIH